MYALVYTRGNTLPMQSQGDYSILEISSSLEEISSKRGASGDLVVHYPSLKIVKGNSWYFGWEKEADRCYASDMQAKQRIYGGTKPEIVPSGCNNQGIVDVNGTQRIVSYRFSDENTILCTDKHGARFFTHYKSLVS